MMDAVTAGRLAANRLAPRCRGGVADVVRAVCGIQAQDAAAARLSVRARSEGLVARDVDAAARAPARGLEAGPAAGDPDAAAGVVRVWAWRGTLHLLAREDVPWVLALVAERANRSVASRWRALRLDEEAYTRARAAIAERLASGPATRAELRAVIEDAGVDASGQRLPHLVRRVAFEGRLHHPLDGTFAALSLNDAPSREEALAELGRRYAAAYGSTAPEDLAAWSGLGLPEARAAWVGSGETAASEGVSCVRLLPAFDTYLLGYRERPVAPGHEKRVWPGGGWIHPVVLVDGKAAGTWRLGGGEVVVDAWDDVPARELADEAADVRRFLT